MRTRTPIFARNFSIWSTSSLLLACASVHAKPVSTTLTQLSVSGAAQRPQAAVNCDDISIGSSLKDGRVDDVVNAGAVRPDYLSGQVHFSQSEPHTFYIRGSTPLANIDPVIYSMQNSGSVEEGKHELRAQSHVRRENNLVMIDVNYADTQCDGDYELMQMDVHLANGCGVLSPQWLVACDASKSSAKKDTNAFENLFVVTGDG